MKAVTYVVLLLTTLPATLQAMQAHSRIDEWMFIGRDSDYHNGFRKKVHADICHAQNIMGYDKQQSSKVKHPKKQSNKVEHSQQQSINVEHFQQQSSKQTISPVAAKSCTDHMVSGSTTDGYYQLQDSQGKTYTYTVYCDFNSEPGVAWTLAMSFSLANNVLPQFKSTPLSSDAPVNEKSPNWPAYRLPLTRMKALLAHSTHWRVTCSFPKYGIDYKDYLRARLKYFDPISLNGSKVCKKVEYINIRGQPAAHTSAPFWQKNYMLHVNSNISATQASGCAFSAAAGSVTNENNFGFYEAVNTKFRCCESPSSTTQYWFGGNPN
ncbi:uncharacterized protein LOC116618425 [Nematostella vectensis]|uniref:uncharacterized protein LOC116618425 n=1 Tax=Nematostella vectensis TaxID=45351 RepID=UPI0020774DFD|nr:uncharacterized protein LOC116618425 [Nematostella vectensis]XP_032237940.2 uncharacterized protein LOC116618425 [Nematostella vectensis]XP_032237941.2 uncharacterized protein LOC116618425 [Nematostella vectensis]